jgi:hypothetical protein
MIGTAAVATPLSAPEEGAPARQNKLHWGAAPIEPHHYTWSYATVVRPMVSAHPDITCRAILVLGDGSFKEKRDSKPVHFEGGGIIVQAGSRYKYFSLEFFQRHFVLENGQPIEYVFQIDYQAPQK